MNWEWGSVEKGRAERALKVKIDSLDLNNADPSGVFIGSGGGQYTCTLEDCTCPDFVNNERKKQRQPCKHIIRLAMEAGILNDEGRTQDEQSACDFHSLEQKLANYAWHYYILDDPLIPDHEYDAMKRHYLKMLTELPHR